FYRFLSLFSLVLFFFAKSIFAQTGSIKGVVTDSTDNSNLWGANILILGTTRGATTNSQGVYRIDQLSPGEINIVYRYLGYQADTAEVKIIANRVLELNIALKPAVIQGDEVVITSQLQGQAAAINQQVNSNTIVKEQR
ncbi:MAG: carboxypeptidase-like regulatory domain-containing protein, partial [Ignavibacteriaceae bacterium]